MDSNKPDVSMQTIKRASSSKWVSLPPTPTSASSSQPIKPSLSMSTTDSSVHPRNEKSTPSSQHSHSLTQFEISAYPLSFLASISHGLTLTVLSQFHNPPMPANYLRNSAWRTATLSNLPATVVPVISIFVPKQKLQPTPLFIVPSPPPSCIYQFGQDPTSHGSPTNSVNLTKIPLNCTCPLSNICFVT